MAPLKTGGGRHEGRLSCSSTGVRPLLGRRFRLGRVPPFRPSHVLAPPRVLAPSVGQPRPQVRQGAVRAGEAVFDAAPLERIRWADAVDGHPPVGQLDPTVPRRHLVGQWPQVRFQHDPLMSERRHPVPRQTAVRAARSPAAEPSRSPLRSPHTTRVGTLTPSAQGTRRTGRVGRAGPEEAGVGPGGASGNRRPGGHGRDLLPRAGAGAGLASVEQPVYDRPSFSRPLATGLHAPTHPQSAPVRQRLRGRSLPDNLCASSLARQPVRERPVSSNSCSSTPVQPSPRDRPSRSNPRTAGLCPAVPARPEPAQQLMRGQPPPRPPPARPTRIQQLVRSRPLFSQPPPAAIRARPVSVQQPVRSRFPPGNSCATGLCSTAPARPAPCAPAHPQTAPAQRPRRRRARFQ